MGGSFPHGQAFRANLFPAAARRTKPSSNTPTAGWMQRASYANRTRPNPLDRVSPLTISPA